MTMNGPVRGTMRTSVPPGSQHPGDFCGRRPVVVDVLEKIEAKEPVERAGFEGERGGPHLDKSRAEKLPAGLEVFEIEVGMDPAAAFFPEKPAQDPLGAAEVEAEVAGPDRDPLFDQVDLFLFFQGPAGDFELPGKGVRHARHYIPSPAGPKTAGLTGEKDSPYDGLRRENEAMKYQMIVVGPLETNCYLIYDEETKDCLIVDPGADADRIFPVIAEEELKPMGILNTHGHIDHIGANRDMKDKYDVPLYMHAGDKDRQPRINQLELSLFLGAKDSPPAGQVS